MSASRPLARWVSRTSRSDRLDVGELLAVVEDAPPVAAAWLPPRTGPRVAPIREAHSRKRANRSTSICSIKCGRSINTQFSVSSVPSLRHQSITRMWMGLPVALTPR